MNWYAQQRQNWISEMLNIYGYINRSHIVAKFGCSPQSAGNDLTKFQASNAAWVQYDPRRKAYVKIQPKWVGIDYPRQGAEQSVVEVLHNGN